MVIRYIKRCLPSLIMEIQIKITMRCHFPSVGMAIIKKIKDSNYWQGCTEKETLTHHWWECKLIQPLWKTIWRNFKNLKIELPYHPAIRLLNIYLKEMKSLSWRNMSTPCSLPHYSQLPRHGNHLNVNRWIKKEKLVCVCVCVCVKWNFIQP